MISLHKTCLEGSGFGEARSELNLWCRDGLENELHYSRQKGRSASFGSPDIWGWGCLKMVLLWKRLTSMTILGRGLQLHSSMYTNILTTRDCCYAIYLM